MRLIIGQFSQKALEDLQHVLEHAARYGQDVIFPYWGETPVQVIDVPRRIKRMRFWISSYAHKARP